jgi:hypothetical protein
VRTIYTTNGNDWIEVVAPTKEQRTELRSATPERRREIAATLRKPAEPADIAVALPIYEKHKIEGASLIACDIALPAGTGIINCRVDGEHKQIRF